MVTTTTGPGRTERREAARALAEHSWAKVDTPRPMARPHLVLLAVALVAAGALGAGVVLQLVHPVPLPKPTKPAAPPAATAAPYTAVSGWDCAGASDRGFDLQGRTTAWYTVGSGGWAQDGCHGTFEAIPMSGDSTRDDTNVSAVWWFKPGTAMNRCEVQVFVPAPQNRQDAAATAAQFRVLTGRTGAQVAGFVLNQTAQPGHWAAMGTFPASDSGIAVELVNRGVPATVASRLAVTQVRVHCTA